MLEDKSISFVQCGSSHVMCLDINGRLYGWGDGKGGCLGLGDSKKRLSVCPITFFEDKRCIDVACGDGFTVVIAEVFPEKTESQEETEKQFDLQHQFKMRLQRIKQESNNLKSVRKPLCGGDNYIT